MRSEFFIDDRFGTPPDLLRVGRLKAVGNTVVSESGTLPIAPICHILRRRGIALRLLHPRSKRRYRRAETAFVRQLSPIQISANREMAAYYCRSSEQPPILYAYDEKVLSELLACNPEVLRGYPASPDAFIELIHSVYFQRGCDVLGLIELAFGYPSPGLLYDPTTRKPLCGRTRWQIFCPSGRPAPWLSFTGYFQAEKLAHYLEFTGCPGDGCPQGKHTIQIDHQSE